MKRINKIISLILTTIIISSCLLYTTNGFAEDYPEEAKRAGITYEEYQAMMALPDFPESEEYIETRSANMTSQQQKVVDLARECIGVPYVYGGASKSGFDCSGLVMYVYKNAVGIGLPHKAALQAGYGSAVSLNALQPGDLLFFKGDGKNVTHVAIYIGNNQFIHAPKKNDKVKITNIAYYKPDFARRLLSSAPVDRLEGHLDVVNSSVIGGWAKDPDNDNISLNVHIYIRKPDGTYVSSEAVSANSYRPDVGKHSFHYNMSWKKYVPGTYKVYAYAIGENNPMLSGSPKTFTVRPIEGNVEIVSKGQIAGWMWKPDAPNESIETHVYIYDSSGKQVHGMALKANQFRQDLVNYGKGNGYHGFGYRPDWSTFPKDILTVRIYGVDGSGVHPLLYTGTVDNRTSDAPEINGIYSIIVRHSGQYMDIYNGNKSAGTKVIQYFGNGQTNQKFRLTDAGDGYFYIELLHAKGMVLCAPDASNSDRSVTIEAKDTSSDKQKFTFAKSDGAYIIKPKSDLSQCFDVADASREYGASVLLWSVHGADNQRWILDKVN